MSLDPSKPLPHEYEEGKLSRYSDNVRQKYLTNIDLSEQQNDSSDSLADDHESKIVSQYAHANDSVLLNKTEFREILMSALNISSSLSNDVDQTTMMATNTRTMQLNSVNTNVVVTPSMNDNEQNGKIITDEPASPATDDIVYPNQTVEQTLQTPNDVELKSTKPISLDRPEVDKLLNEGNLQVCAQFMQCVF